MQFHLVTFSIIHVWWLTCVCFSIMVNVLKNVPNMKSLYYDELFCFCVSRCPCIWRHFWSLIQMCRMINSNKYNCWKMSNSLATVWRAPRFWSSQCVHDREPEDPGHVGLWTDCPAVDMLLNYDCLTVRADSCENHHPQSSGSVQVGTLRKAEDKDRIIVVVVRGGTSH